MYSSSTPYRYNNFKTDKSNAFHRNFINRIFQIATKKYVLSPKARLRAILFDKYWRHSDVVSTLNYRYLFKSLFS